MAEAATPLHGGEVYLPPNKRLNLTDADFVQRRPLYYQYLREHLPVHPGRIFMVKIMTCARYEDCLFVLKDDRFIRNRSVATGSKRRSPVPLPKHVEFLASSMINEDDPEHKRLRTLVQKAFAPKSLRGLEAGIRESAHALVDQCMALCREHGQVDLQTEYALPIPTRVISAMMGVADDDMPNFRNSLTALTRGMSGWNVLRTMLFDLPRSARFVRELIERKREAPADDILTQLIEAEEEGDRLTEDELVAMVFLLIIAGFETTVHLVTNGVFTLLQHPEQLERLRGEPQLMGSAVEEILRFAGPIHTTKPNYAVEDVELRGVVIPKGTAVMPLLGAANRDPAMFDDPERFDVARDPNKHLAFSQGRHFCLGAFLARMETRVALEVLLERAPELRLAVPAESLKLASVPGWYRYEHLPVKLTG